MASFNAFSMDGDNLHVSNNHFDLDDVVIESYADYGSYTDRVAAVPASPNISKFKDPAHSSMGCASSKLFKKEDNNGGGEYVINHVISLTFSIYDVLNFENGQ
ncbi:hypothetical protein ACFX11_038343 [Malus domestica]